MYIPTRVILHSGVCINKRYCRCPDIDQRYHLYSCIDIRYRVDRDHLHQCLCMLVKKACIQVCIDIDQRYQKHSC